MLEYKQIDGQNLSLDDLSIKKGRGLSCAYNGNVPVTNTTAKTREIVDSSLTNT